MREFEAFRFIALANVLGSIVSTNPDEDTTIADDWKAANLEAIEAFLPVLLDLGMDASHASLERLIQRLNSDGVRFGDLIAICAEVNRTGTVGGSNSQVG